MNADRALHEPTGEVLDFYRRICCDRLDALDFVSAFHYYGHEIDDNLDGNKTDAETWLRTLAHAAVLYSKPFFRQHADVLLPHVVTVTSMYADSVKWEAKDQPLWKRQWADVLRHAGNEMTMAVAYLCGGYENVRKHSAALRAMSFVHHADQYGVPK